MSPRTIALSLGGTVIVGGAGAGITFLSGVFNKPPQSSIRKIVWKNKPQIKPNFDSSEWQSSGAEAIKWGAKETVFEKEAGKLHDSNHPWAKELLAFMSRGAKHRIIPSLIAEWCVSNSDGDVDINSTKGQMLTKLCDVTFE